MIHSLIVAMDRSRGIGRDNTVPWRLSDDLRRFKRLTMGHHLVVGRKTYQTIGKPLPGRTMVVISHDPDYRADGSLIAHSLKDAINITEERGENEVFIIGGGQIYSQTITTADRIYLTHVDTDADCDVFFPEINSAEWVLTMTISQEANQRNQHPFVFKILERALTNP